jgi:hypothetical protein
VLADCGVKICSGWRIKISLDELATNDVCNHFSRAMTRSAG